MESIMTPCKSIYQGGFSYLFTLLMVAMLGLGLTLAADVYVTSARRDKEKELLSIGRQFRNAIRQYYETNQKDGAVKQYPASIQDLLVDSQSLSVKRYLRKIFIDPMTGKAEWGEVRVAGRLVGVHSLSNQVPIKRAFTEPDELQFNGKAKYSDWFFTYPSDLLVIPTKSESGVAVPESIVEAGK